MEGSRESGNDAAQLARSTRLLWDTFLNGNGIFPLLEMAASIFEGPVFVKSGELYHAFPPNFPGPIPERFIGRLLACAATEATECNRAVRLTGMPAEAEQLPYGAVCAAISLRGQILGHLAVCGGMRPLSESDLQTAANLSGMLAILIGTDSFTMHNKDIPYAMLFHALLKGEDVAPTLIGAYLETLPRNDERIMSILAIDCRSADEKQAVALRDVCGSMVTCSMRAIYQGHVVLLYHGRRQYPLEEHHNFLEYLRHNGWVCGMSSNFSDFSRISHFYGQAGAAARLGPRLRPGKTLYSYEECLLFHVIELASGQVALDDLASPRLRALCEYDAAKGSELVETLRVYLSNINNLNAAAEKLSIHRNTLFYRLRKIESVTGWDLDQGENLMDIHFYLKIMDMENR